MFQFPTDPKKIKERISRYERELKKEYDKFKYISDDSGKRYLLGPLYLLLGDNEGALRSFEWFEKTFPDDMGEPFQYLCWTLALYRAGDLSQAKEKLRQTMLANLYLIPYLLGIKQEVLNIWHSSNDEEIEYLQYCPQEFLELWNPADLKWAKETYESEEIQQVRRRYIDIFHQLLNVRPGPERRELVAEAFKLRESHPGQ